MPDCPSATAGILHRTAVGPRPVNNFGLLQSDCASVGNPAAIFGLDLFHELMLPCGNLGFCFLTGRLSPGHFSTRGQG